MIVTALLLANEDTPSPTNGTKAIAPVLSETRIDVPDPGLEIGKVRVLLAATEPA